MRFNEYLESIQGTEQEEKLFELVNKFKDDIGEAQEQVSQVPVLGKIVNAVAFLVECGNVEDYLESEHAQLLQGWDVKADLDKGIFNVYPGKEIRMKLFAVLGVAAAVILLLVLICRKCRGRK